MRRASDDQLRPEPVHNPAYAYAEGPKVVRVKKP